jgi:protein subunit release factor A
VERLESRIAVLEDELRELEERLGDPDVLADREAVAAAGERHRGVEQELAWLLREWEQAAEASG